MAKHFFSKYGSLTNHYDAKFITRIRNSEWATDDVEWVAREKIHGANFGFWFDGTEVKTSKRSGINGGDNFYSSWKLDKYKDAVISTYSNILEEGLAEDGDNVVIFGEIFGGSFFGEQEEGSRQVQRGMNYHPGTEFMAYDIIVHPKGASEDDKVILTDNQMLDVLDDGIKVCPVVGRGTFEELLKLDNDFPSLVPEEFGLKVPEGKRAQSEGFVMKPADITVIAPNGKRLIIKSKNDKFSETNGSAKQAPKPIEYTEEELAIYAKFTTYLNSNRLAAVISKIGEVTWKDFGKLVGMLMSDALDEYGEDLKSSDFWKKARKPLSSVASEVIREYLKENINDQGPDL